MSEGARDTPALNWSDLGVSELLPDGNGDVAAGRCRELDAAVERPNPRR